uniref:FZ domain-containing protein n=1 Tax=Eptatretus burgeri TaxID=7764 RepID=A0A8C4Q8M8_EPTBU
MSTGSQQIGMTGSCRLPTLDRARMGPMLLVLFLIYSSPVTSFSSICEPMRVPMCTGMPWDLTRVPNLLHHGTQGNAALAIEPFQALLDTNCSEDLRFFLCAMYAPVCAGALVADDPIQPCRAVCERARARCEPVVLRYGHQWPEALACNSLPVYEHAVCIQPKAIVLGLPHGLKFCMPIDKVKVGKLKEERVAEEFANRLSGDLGGLGALGNPQELWSAFEPTILDVAGGCLGTHWRAMKNFVSRGTLDIIDQSRRARLNGRAELFRELGSKTVRALRVDKEASVWG